MTMGSPDTPPSSSLARWGSGLRSGSADSKAASRPKTRAESSTTSHLPFPRQNTFSTLQLPASIDWIASFTPESVSEVQTTTLAEVISSYVEKD